MNARVLVTGASGFVGRPLVRALSDAGLVVRAATRMPNRQMAPGVEVVPSPELTQPADWRPLLAGIEAVVHLAGIAHIGPGVGSEAYDRVNRAATAELAQAAAQAGVRHLIFMSSIRAQTGPSAEGVLSEDAPPCPTDDYGRSKLLAEEAVRASGVPFTILRPVLVHGPGAKGNLAVLIKIAASPWPLPFASFANKRSLLGVDNLIAAVLFALRNPASRGQTYIVADPEPLTLGEIISVLRQAMGRPPGLFAWPPALFAGPLKWTGQGDLWERIGGSLIADPAKLIAAGWRPDTDTRTALARLVEHRL